MKSRATRWRHWAPILGFFLAGIVTRVPFRSHLLYHWDSVNFALAVEHFDVRLHQPHPPGYIVYVALGWLANCLAHDPNAGFVWLSVLFSGLTAAAVFVLGREMFGTFVGAGAALFALTSPAIWFYGEVALTYILEAFFVTAIALGSYRVLCGEMRWTWVTTALLGVAGGIRQTTLVLLLPLWFFTLRQVSWKRRVGACALLGVLVLAWFVPTVALSGGLNSYLADSRAIGGGVLSGFALFGVESLLAPLGRLAIYLIYGLMGGLPLLAYLAIREGGELCRMRKLWQDKRVQVLTLWLVPNLAFYAPLVRASGHTFSFLSALIILVGAGAAVLRRDLSKWKRAPRAVLISIIGILLVANVLFFLVAPPFLFGIHRVASTTPSWSTIRYRDISLDTRIAYIRTHFSPTTTALLSNRIDFRHPDYYLRDYFIRRYDSIPPSERVALAEGIDTVVLFGEGLNGGKGARAVELPNGEQMYILHRHPDQEIIVEGTIVSLLSLSP